MLTKLKTLFSLPVFEDDDKTRITRLLIDTLHLLLTDVVMPGMNGQKVYQAVTAASPDTKVLYMPDYTDNVIAHHGILDADVHLLQKPFKVDMLLRKVRNALE